jgi:DNA topoisomerase-1
VPQYDYKGFSIKVQGQTIKLTPKMEQMAVAWVKKAQSQASPPDKVFYMNFIQDFLERLKAANNCLHVLEQFIPEYVRKLSDDDFEILDTGNLAGSSEIDFSEIAEFLLQEKKDKENMTKAQKKTLATQRKAQREKLKERFGYAIVDGNKIEVANWTAEPSCLFAGRGNHPKRGKWKEGPTEQDLILNFRSSDSTEPAGNWKDVVWEPEKMYLAKWQDKLSGKIKYVWFSDSAFLKQKREKEKFNKAEKLGKLIPKVEEHVMKNLTAEDEKRRKIATVCWLIFAVNLRVGDEKDPGEADTVGAITLRPEHIKIEGETIYFDFLGKDSVRWTKSVKAPHAVIRNIEEYSRNCKEYLFEGVDSKKVSRFLSKKMDGLTGKVFRTWTTTKVVEEYLDKSEVKKEDFGHVKKFQAKMANLKGAEVANHKKKVSPKFEESLAKKEARFKELEAKLREKREQGKKVDSILNRIEKAKYDIELAKKTREYNLGTSLKSYIDPRVYVKWARQVDFDLEKFYPATLRKKFSWALGARTAKT